MKYYVLNLGCQMNQADSERIQTVLRSMGFTQTENEHEAQLLGVVACSVRQKAIDRVYSKIHEWNEAKAQRQLLTFVSGCILPADEEKFLKRFDLLFRIDQLSEVPDLIRQYGVTLPLEEAPDQPPPRPQAVPLSPGFRALTPRRSDPEPPLEPTSEVSSAPTPLGGFWQVKPSYTSRFEAFIPIQNGCDKYCTFCAVPYTRGREVSRPSEDILSEVRRLVEEGYKSLTLLGQNVNSYGLDKPGQERNFAQLLDEVGKIGDATGREFWVYFTSPHPRDMSVEVLETMARHRCLAKQVHLPMQSGDDKVLIRMNRNHHMDRYRTIVENIRRLLPEATLFTDIIVGFTGETEEQFQNTARAMEEFRFHMAYIAQYSPRPGAASSRWEDDVPGDEKKRRFRELTDILNRHSLEYTQAQIGRVHRVLVEKADRKAGYLSGRTEGKILVRFAGSEALIGQFVDLRITSAQALSMEGELVPAVQTA